MGRNRQNNSRRRGGGGGNNSNNSNNAVLTARQNPPGAQPPQLQGNDQKNANTPWSLSLVDANPPPPPPTSTTAATTAATAAPLRPHHFRRNKTAPLATHFAERMHLSYLQDTLDYEAYKAKQTAYLQRVADLERAILERTVFVDHMRSSSSSSNPDNLFQLQRFMETNFGPVDECVMVSIDGRQQTWNGNSHGNNRSNHHHHHRRNHHHNHHVRSARVRFVYKEDAEKIFGNRPLSHAQPVRLPCRVLGSVGHDIRVQPSRRYDLRTEWSGPTMVLPVTGLEGGHWVPSRHDVYELWHGTPPPAPPEEWITETRIPGYSFTPHAASLSAKAASGYHLSLKIDLKRRTVEITARRASAFCYGQVETYRFDTPNNNNNNNNDQHAEQDVLVIRFKELIHHMELCRDEEHSTTTFSLTDSSSSSSSSHCYLIARLSVPPRLYRETMVHEDHHPAGRVTRQRCLEFAGMAATTLFG